MDDDGFFRATLLDWSTFASVALFVGVMYALLVALRRRLNRGLYLREADTTVRALLRIFLLVIDPIALLVLLAVFVAIWPFVHGLIAALLLAFGWRHVENYVAGRVLRFDRSVQGGRQLSSRSHSGIIGTFGLTALYLQREDGRRRVGYTQLLDEGYSVAGDPARGGYFRLQVLLPDAEHTLDGLNHDLLANPYAKTDFALEPHPTEGDERLVDVSLGLHRAEHLDYLVDQLRELGYVATVQPR